LTHEAHHEDLEARLAVVEARVLELVEIVDRLVALMEELGE
jgi:hypothetical protein